MLRAVEYTNTIIVINNLCSIKTKWKEGECAHNTGRPTTLETLPSSPDGLSQTTRDSWVNMDPEGMVLLLTGQDAFTAYSEAYWPATLIIIVLKNTMD